MTAVDDRSEPRRKLVFLDRAMLTANLLAEDDAALRAEGWAGVGSGTARIPHDGLLWDAIWTR